MTAGSALFLLSALACVLGAVATIVARNPVRGAMGLLATIVGIAGMFLLLSAEFLAAIQLIVYAGAVVVLFVFVIMLLGADAGAVREDRARLAKLAGASLLAVLAAGVIVALAPRAGQVTKLEPVGAEHGTVEAVGRLLFTEGIVPFELSTALLIVAVVGAIAVARGKPGKPKRVGPVERPTDLFSGPVMPRDDTGRPTPEAEAGKEAVQ
jgi:NADH-quinone oxidoreductase subunit J